MRLFLFMILLCLASKGNSQTYFNKLIPFEFGNPSVGGLYQINDKYYIPTIYFGEVSTLLETDISNHNYYHYSYFDFSRAPLTQIENDIFIFGKDRTKSKALKFAKLNEQFLFDWDKDISTIGEYNFPTNSKKIQEHIYSTFFIEWNEPYHREIGIAKHDKNGNEIWNKTYNQDIELSYPWSTTTTFDNNLLLSAGVHYYDKSGRFSQITKLDTSGNNVWKFSGEEAFADGATPAWITELSDSTILQSYQADRWADLEYIQNNWHFYPIRFLWLNNEGVQIREKMITCPAQTEINARGIKAGKGDYFFMHGTYNAQGSYMGIITKFTNEGDTIWARRYEHPDYANKDIAHRVYDLIEQDNGDLVALGEISAPGNGTKIWMFRVNSEGCFSSAPCEEIVSSTSEQPLINDKSILIYPNPTSDNLTIKLLNSIITNIEVVDIQGQWINSIYPNSSSINLEVQDYTPGMYFVKVNDQQGKSYLQKFVKQ